MKNVKILIALLLVVCLVAAAAVKISTAQRERSRARSSDKKTREMENIREQRRIQEALDEAPIKDEHVEGQIEEEMQDEQAVDKDE